MILKSSLWLGAGFLALTVISGSTYIWWQSRSSQLFTSNFTAAVNPTLNCITIATDPKPPLNIRSSPIVAPDNIIARVNNGTRLNVVDENNGWLRVSAPLEGWVYKELTVTSCTPNGQTTLARKFSNSTSLDDRGERILKDATEQYHAGRLEQAIQLVKSIPTDSAAYPQAQAKVSIWQRDWKLAEAKFSTAQTALQEGRWQDVLRQVNSFPDNRFWRGKLTPLVKEAIYQQNAQTR